MSSFQNLFLSACLALSLVACGNRGGTQESAPPPKSVEPPKPVITCVPVKKAPPATSAATAKPASPAVAKKSASSSLATKGKKPAPQVSKAVASSSSSRAASSAPAEPVPADAEGKCPAGYDAVVSQPAASSSSADNVRAGDKQERSEKSVDGSFEGTVYGRALAGSKLAKVRIGMSEAEVRKIAGLPDDYRTYVTGKAFIPFYFGTDSVRQEWVFLGHGSLAFDVGGFGGGRVVMMINHDPAIR